LATSNKNFKVKNGLDVSGAATAESFVKAGGSAAQFLMADGSISDGAGSLEVSPTPPESPSEGDIWYNSTTGQTFVYYDSFWVENVTGQVGPQGPTGATGPAGQDSTVPGPQGPPGADGFIGADGAEGAQGPEGPPGPEGPEGPAGTFGVLDEAPVDPNEGDVWFNTSDGRFYVYYDDFWVEALSNEAGPQGPAGPAGADGADGADGAVGPQGPAGADSTVPGPQGDPGEQGDPGPGVAAGGTEGQVLLKVDGTDYNTTWADNSAESTFYLVRNNTGTTIPKGTLVAAAGAEPSGRIDVAPFEVTGLENSELRVMGVATTSISNGVNGTVMAFGTLKGIDTRGDVSSAIAVGDETWAAGDILYAHPTVDGKLTKNKPQHDLVVAFITVRHATLGQMAIRITSGTHLEWLHDVAIEEPADGDVLTYNSTNGVWENSQIAGVAGPEGPEGPEGPQGPAGADGVDGETGDTGVVISESEPESTDVLWLDSDAVAEVPVPTGGTTGQVLAKSSSTDYDTEWSTLNTADISDITASAAALNSTSSATSGLTALSNGTSGITYQPVSHNVIINGAFEINQRSFSSATGGAVNQFAFDRWNTLGINGTNTISSQTFTLGEAPVAGYEGKNYLRMTSSGQTLSSAQTLVRQKIEGVRTFAGQTVTYSFWARASSGTPKISLEVSQFFGSGGSPSAVTTTDFGQPTLSTSWVRYSATATIPSLSGKTIGTANDDWIDVKIWTSAGSDLNARTGSMGIQNATIDIWGVQLEAGAVATPFKRNAPSIQAELAACQRYYWRINADNAYYIPGLAIAVNTTFGNAFITFPTTMRANPTSIDFTLANLQISWPNVAFWEVTGLTLSTTLSTHGAMVVWNVASGTTGGTAYTLRITTGGFIGFSAEL
jgi:hypothetical protein